MDVSILTIPCGVRTPDDSAGPGLRSDDLPVCRRVPPAVRTYAPCFHLRREDKQIVDMATRRLTIVMDHVGLTDGGRLTKSHGSVAVAVAQTASESALAKQQAAAHAMRLRAEQVSNDKAKQQNELEWYNGAKSYQHQKKSKGKRAGDALADKTSTKKSRKTKI